MSDYVFVFQEWDMLRANDDTPDDRLEKTSSTPTVRGQTYGGRIQEARIRKRLTISDLARNVGISARSMSMLENGSEMPSADVASRLNSLLEIE